MKPTFFLGLFGAVALAALTSSAQPQPTADASLAPSSVQAQGAITPPAEISPGAAEIIRMASSGVSEDVILAYISNAQTPFDLTADQVVYLKDLGISPNIVTAMINRDTTLRNSPAAAANAQPAPPPPPSEPPVVEGPMTPTAETAPPEDVSYFYDDLAPYGSWVVLDGVGWCWQPRTVVIASGWRPYCDGGHWVYSECGWYWESDYSWGWAPFHYGRWYMHPRCGWVWTPDRLWGPAWVTWRVAGDNCGWAPLPPHAVFVGGSWLFNGVHVSVNFDFGLRPDHFTFVGVHDFIGHDIRHHALPIHEVRNVYRHTTIVNNTTVVRNNVIVNRGIPVERVSAVTHTTIKPAVLREAPAGAGRVERLGGRSGQPAVYRHELPSHPKPARVTAEHVDSSHPIVHHNELPPVQTGRSYSSSGASSGGRSSALQSRNTRSSRDSSTTVSPSHNTTVSPKQNWTSQPGLAPGASKRDRDPQRQEYPNPSVSKPPTKIAPSVQEPKTAPPAVKSPKASEQFNYGRYGDTPQNRSSLQVPKPSTVEPSHQWSEKPSGGSSYQGPTHNYTPKSYQQSHENYSPPPSRSERVPSYSAPSHSERSYSAPAQSDRSYSAPSHSEHSSSGGGSSSRDTSRDDSGSGRKH